MAIEKHTRTIDGQEIIIVTLGGRKSLALQARLAKLLGPALKQVFPLIQSFMKTAKENKVDMKDKEAAANAVADNVKKSFLDNNLDLSPVAAAFTDMLAQLDVDDLLDLATTMMRGVLIDGKDMSSEANFDMIFSGNLGLLYRIMALVVEVNFGNFFAMVGIGNRQPS